MANKEKTNQFEEVFNQKETWEDGMMLWPVDADEDELKELMERIDEHYAENG